MKTLFLSDLDGTLLQRDATISPKSCAIINRLVEQGMIFSYATARSIHTAVSVTRGLHVRVPVITKNGAFIDDIEGKKTLCENVFSWQDTQDIYDHLQKYGINPLVFSVVDGQERYSYDCENMSRGVFKFVKDHEGDFRDHPVKGNDTILEGKVHYFTCIGAVDELQEIYQRLAGEYNCIFSKDTYSDDQWLEIMPKYATKAYAMKQLQQLCGCDRVVVFGDGINDVSMFEMADECYAVGNAVSALKEIATDVIGENEMDGVAEWLQQRFLLS
ncbi:MAG: HAD family hydrolase [Eubacteriales bacterium]|nr:HAD family hydrolase [Eubacteriales bacterium]